MGPTLPGALRAVRWPHARGQLTHDMHGGGMASMLKYGMQHAVLGARAGGMALARRAAPVGTDEDEEDDAFDGRASCRWPHPKRNLPRAARQMVCSVGQK